MDEQFGFKVRYQWTERYDTDENFGCWHVTLPHQCEDWEIAGWKHLGYGEYGLQTRDEAIASLTQFVAEAQHALEVLKSSPENPGTESWFPLDD